MQTQKAKNGSPDVLKKLSPRSARPLKLAALKPDSSSSPLSANNRTPKDKSLKFPDRKPPRSLVFEEYDLKFGGISGERAGLAAVVKEIRQLKLQTEMVASSEAGHAKLAELRNSEIHLLRGNLMDTLSLVENFRNLLKVCEVTEAETEALATETLRQLESAKKAIEELKSDGTTAVESYKKLVVELEQSLSRTIWLEGLVTKLLANPGGLESQEKARLVDKETVLQFISEEKDNNLKLMKNQKETGVEAEIKQLREAMENLRAELVDKETELQIVSGENGTLIHKMETDVQDALMKLGIAMEEANKKSSQRAIRVTEQLDATQASNSEMETELRKLKVQSNKWRKAAGNNSQTNSSYSGEIDYEVTKKKTGNVLKRIGVFWKKPQK